MKHKSWRRRTATPDRGREVDAPAHAMSRWQHRSGSDTSAALTAARRKDGTASASAHPEPKPVGLGPTPVVGLERTLGHEGLRGLTGRAGTAPAGHERPTVQRRPRQWSNRGRLSARQLLIFSELPMGSGETRRGRLATVGLVVDNRWTRHVQPGNVRPRTPVNRPPADPTRWRRSVSPTACG